MKIVVSWKGHGLVSHLFLNEKCVGYISPRWKKAGWIYQVYEIDDGTMLLRGTRASALVRLIAKNECLRYVKANVKFHDLKRLYR